MNQNPALEVKKLTCSIQKEQQLQYIEVPFELEADVINIQVKYKVKNSSAEECVIDLGIRDSERVRGWSGGARREIEVGLNQATPGYLSGRLPAGNWAVLLGAYRIPKDGCEVEVGIQVEKRIHNEGTWLKGDLHLHSIHSDGSYTLEESTAIATRKGLDFIALTDHNTVSQNFAKPAVDGLIIIPGMELTTYRGHCNFFGVNDPIKDFRALTNEELIEKIEEARSNGAKVSINHPHDPGCPWEWTWDVNYNTVEVWNGPWRQGNEATLDWWQEKLVNGNKITVIGGSDTHRPDPFVQHGMPTTWVNTEVQSPEGILAAIDEGKVFLSYSPEGPTIDLTCGNKQMGETVTDISQPVNVKINGLNKGDEIRIISDGGIEQAYTIPAFREYFQEEWMIDKQKFYRIEVRRYFPEVAETLMVAMSNPLYIDQNGN